MHTYWDVYFAWSLRQRHLKIESFGAAWLQNPSRFLISSVEKSEFWNIHLYLLYTITDKIIRCVRQPWSAKYEFYRRVYKIVGLKLREFSRQVEAEMVRDHPWMTSRTFFWVFSPPPLCHAFTQPISTICHALGNLPPRAWHHLWMVLKQEHEIIFTTGVPLFWRYLFTYMFIFE